jgi:hypothetical protein
MRLYKPARSKECGRGYFSYLTEAVGNLLGFYQQNKEDAKVFFDLYDIPGYGKGNMFDVAFIQDHEDYKMHAYHNIEEFSNLIGSYETSWDKDIRQQAQQIIEKHFVLRSEITDLIKTRFKNYDFNRIVGVHRRSTDIIEHHSIVDLSDIFNEIDSIDHDYIFLATDSNAEYSKFKERYGEKILFFDETASDNKKPFFKLIKNQEEIEKHIREIVFTVYALSKTKKLICSRSNLAIFSILINSELDYVVKV